jgi:AcrR family transcriptional regulator
MDVGRHGRKPGPITRTPSTAIDDALIEAAERVLLRSGPEAVTVRAVALEAGVAPMGVYNHFGGKDGLVDELTTRGFLALRNAVAVELMADSVECLRTFASRYREFALEYPSYYAVMFGGAIQRDKNAPAHPENVRATFDELVGLVRLNMAAGRLGQWIPQQAAQQIWSTLHGAIQIEMAGMLQVADAERAYDQLFTVLIRGLS